MRTAFVIVALIAPVIALALPDDAALSRLLVGTWHGHRHEGLISSFPVRVCDGKWEIVPELPINDFSRSKIDASVAELKEEKSFVSELIP